MVNIRIHTTEKNKPIGGIMAKTGKKIAAQAHIDLCIKKWKQRNTNLRELPAPHAHAGIDRGLLNVLEASFGNLYEEILNDLYIAADKLKTGK